MECRVDDLNRPGRKTRIELREVKLLYVQRTGLIGVILTTNGRLHVEPPNLLVPPPGPLLNGVPHREEPSIRISAHTQNIPL